MIKKIFYISTFFIFIIFITNFYFSSYNVKKVNKSRYKTYSENKNSDIDIPLLKSDTNNIIEYKDEIEVYKKKKKNYKFWDLIKKKIDE